MRFLLRARATSLLLGLIAVGATAVAFAHADGQAAGDRGEKRRITEKDLFDFVWLADPQVAFDGSRVAFTRVVTDAKRTGYETSIWIVPARASGGGDAGAAPRRLTGWARTLFSEARAAALTWTIISPE